MIGISIFVLLVSTFILFYSFYSYNKLKIEDRGTDKMKFISDKIANGADQFLRCLYKYLAIFICVTSILLFSVSYSGYANYYISHLGFLFFIFGASISILAGFIGMKISTVSNVITANKAAKNGLKEAFNTSFNSGSLIGMSIVGLGLLGLSLILLGYSLFCPSFKCYFNSNLILFTLGVESVALFCRVAGGIYTKAADVGADLVGKIEQDIPEDDPRNPAVIADNVGDNVGDIAGMGTDLLGSFVSAIVSCIFLGTFAANKFGYILNTDLLVFPLFFCFVGTLISILVSKALIYIKSNKVEDLFKNGVIWITLLNILLAFVSIFCFFDEKICLIDFGTKLFCFNRINIFYCISIGLIISTLVSFCTKYYTDKNYSPLKYIIKQSKSGASTNVIAGLCVGMESVLIPIVLYSLGILGCYYLAGFYGISLAAIGVMSTAMIQLSIDAFGPIADNAGGIAEMSGLDDNVRNNTDILDSLGNTTAATGKSFAVTSAIFAFFALFAGIGSILNSYFVLNDSYVISGLLLGSMVPYIFSSMAIKSVGSAAIVMVEEVRRQFKEIIGLKEGTTNPEYDKCIEISTKAALKGMLTPGIIVILLPILILIFANVYMLVGYLIGSALSAVLMGLFQSNSGGAWDNAKKAFENGVNIDGDIYFKKSFPHKSAVVGDTIGDPLKDTSGPSMNIVLKLGVLLSLILIPVFYYIKPTNYLNTKCCFYDYCDIKEKEEKVEKEEPRIDWNNMRNVQYYIDNYKNLKDSDITKNNNFIKKKEENKKKSSNLKNKKKENSFNLNNKSYNNDYSNTYDLTDLLKGIFDIDYMFDDDLDIISNDKYSKNNKKNENNKINKMKINTKNNLKDNKNKQNYTYNVNNKTKSNDKPEVIYNEDGKGNYEKLVKNDNGYSYEYYYNSENK